MSNYRITTFDGFSFTQTGVYTDGGTVGNLEARVKVLFPPHSAPLDPYGGSVAPVKLGEIKANILLSGDPDTIDGLVQSMRAKVGVSGTLSGRAGTGTGTCTAYCSKLSGDWSPPFMNASPQFLSLTLTFQPTTDWA